MGADTLFGVTMKADTAADGTGISNNTPALKGMLWGFYVKYHASIDAGTDVTIKTTLPDGTQVTLLTITDNKTSGFYPLRMAEKKSNGADSGGYGYYALTSDVLSFTVAGAGATPLTDGVKVYAKIV